MNNSKKKMSMHICPVMSVTEADRLFRFYWGLIFRITIFRALVGQRMNRDHLAAPLGDATAPTHPHLGTSWRRNLSCGRW